MTDDPFPQLPPIPLDIPIDDDGLTTLEKIYLYSRSKAAFHRVFIAHALPSYLANVSPQEAVQYVLPLLSGLAMDEDEPVKEALAAELVPVIWWFFTHCQIIPDDAAPEETYASSSTTVTISVQAFTPILGTLLLSSNPLVGGAARFSIVDLLSRMKKADDKELGIFRHSIAHTSGHAIHPWEIAHTDADNEDDDDADSSSVIGLFGNQERAMFTSEILQQVVIGMGRLDVGLEPEEGKTSAPEVQRPSTPSPRTLPQAISGNRVADNINPYFPILPSTSQTSANLTPRPASQPAAADTLSTRSRPTTMSNSFSPGSEFPPSLGQNLPSSNRPMSPPSLDHSHDAFGFTSTSRSPKNVDWDDVYEGDEGDDDQAAVGRLSSMSLMAAVTANGTLEEDIQRAFVKEVERVGRDPVYWVRREASFALGALAKVVPEEIVISSLLPLFDSLRWDPVWHVRHSALFALPAILARLSPARRRVVALETIIALASDQNSTVRSGVLEALGEVLHTFHEDLDGPPQELVDLFLGRKEDVWVRAGQEGHPDVGYNQLPLDLFYTDSRRPLICAFNFPAVALTLGTSRWGELRDPYLDMTSNPSCAVRRTLAASLGELAKIIGREHSHQDLVGFWWIAVRSEDEEVRLKCIQCLHDFLIVIDAVIGKALVQGLLTAWNDGVLRSWRERDLIEKNLAIWMDIPGIEGGFISRRLLMKGLEDNVAAVRETAISALVDLWILFASQREVIDDIRDEMLKLSRSLSYRRRMTFIACQQALAFQDGVELESTIESVAELANDEIEGVRIGVARFASAVLDSSSSISSALHHLVQRISQDSSHQVRAYLLKPPATSTGLASRRGAQLAAFSRPPACRSADRILPSTCGHIGLQNEASGKNGANGVRPNSSPLVGWEDMSISSRFNDDTI